MILKTSIRGRVYKFKDVKEVLAKANDERSGDILAGVAAESDEERVAAKQVLANMCLEDLRNNPVVPYEEDEVTRVIQDQVNENAYRKIKSWTVGQLKEFIHDDKTTFDDIDWVSKGLTSEMVAGVAKLSSTMDLVSGAAKIRRVTHANTTVGLPGTLASRLQPNHPTDDVEAIIAQTYEGLSYGIGDAVLGINPVIDDPENVSRLLNTLYDIIVKWNIPTQHAVLAHVTTQMECIRRGAPIGLVFQSVAGSQKGNEAFGISVEMLDEAYELVKKYSINRGPNFFYFETGQGSELSSNSHHGADQVTMEARCYGLAKRYSPLIVNTVVGFIGPEYLYNSKQVIRAGLEDHFMGKLTGISMGVDVCYTNHMKADQDDIENLAVLLAAAGTNYFIGVPMGDDIMLNYQCGSFHDIATIRQTFGFRPSPEFEPWLEKMGIMKDGKLTEIAGDPTIFLT
ncbi:MULTISPECIES: ethanolamine ammonia-lyase subunit EutB [Tepidanaerobacter]|uniref:Ethanolamine ammonia-lyase large subunit n=1 Tax=Tepidanaerobacter syntrophicus TaxID=224999 RepID=A0A0U9HJY2_9FIRM|nr:MULTISPECIES: ethanolamine ammonia-lyase subunit EutB [Tepidanaerobacter]GAQ24097.1 ethanolamine ammonia-lyase large subunit [Tepidanaerobacter syntrophicus]GLI19548.1 ethanolamine transporter [Tepidanaerobacter syntrophicus]GLI51746.1 ethanolamine transporter [Tepidanaerobacter syntrophicus]HHV83946.1 ethanolamine ammonia-lyase subunit EutB [Tepidanaerobacter syntrophicus]